MISISESLTDAIGPAIVSSVLGEDSVQYVDNIWDDTDIWDDNDIWEDKVEI